MLSDICIKSVACAQVAMYRSLNKWAQEHPTAVAKTAAACVAIADIALDTLKHPGVVTESLCMAAINLTGACCSDSFSLEDTQINLKLTAIGILTTIIASTLAIPKLVIQVQRAVFDPARVHSYNTHAEAEARFQFIVPSHSSVNPSTVSNSNAPMAVGS